MAPMTLMAPTPQHQYIKLMTGLFNDNFKSIVDFNLKPYEKRMLILPFPNPKSVYMEVAGVVVRIEEYANYRRVDTRDLNALAATVLTLSEEAALGYAFNVISLITRGGNLQYKQSKRLGITDPDLHVNMVKNQESTVGGCPGESLTGWVSYRYKFAGALI
jgi:hypothetical protein